ncbi:hypothetical protein [Confluentibacter citreus]|uniref:hypothetical protein n=1 Tax=Confluentibacter citreus TaxID=2007307 RepID=UPI000C28A0B0|nr:hypothetical protein [Confluentibacter citreus]
MKKEIYLLDKSAESIKYSKPLYLLLPIQLLNTLSIVIAFFHVFLIKRRWAKISDIIFNSPEGYEKMLQKIWFTRMMRRLLSVTLRTPFRSKAIKLVNNKLTLPELGCIIAIPHTPWAKLLAEWCRSNNFALVFAGGPWIKRTGHLNVSNASLSQIRKLVSHLNSKKFVVVIGDNENRSRCCQVTYFGKKCNASLLPVRLATLASVPITVVIPKFDKQQINLVNGPTIDSNTIISNKKEALQKIFSYYENEVYASPSIYYPYILGSLNT